MSARLKKTRAALTIAMVVGLAALGWWCGKLYTANVEQTAALSDVQTTASQLRTEIDDQSKVIDQLTEQLAQTNDGGLRRVQQLEAQLADLEGQIDEIRGVSWLPYASRDMTELDRDIGQLERDLYSLNQCVDSIARLANGGGSYVFC